MSGQKNGRAENGEVIRKLPSTDPEARDEGPRLIPFTERRRQEMPVENNRRYMDLAERAIRRKPPAAQSSPHADRQRKSR